MKNNSLRDILEELMKLSVITPRDIDQSETDIKQAIIDALPKEGKHGVGYNNYDYIEGYNTYRTEVIKIIEGELWKNSK